MAPEPSVDDYPRAGWRRHAVLVMLAVLTAGGLMLLLTRPPKPVPAHLVPAPRWQPGELRPPGNRQAQAGSDAVLPGTAAAGTPASAAAEPPRCAPGQTTACVGGRAAVFAVPAPR